jgi:hypothetical protein
MPLRNHDDKPLKNCQPETGEEEKKFRASSGFPLSIISAIVRRGNPVPFLETGENS